MTTITRLANLSFKAFWQLIASDLLSQDERDALLHERCRHDLKSFAAYFFGDACSVAFCECHHEFFAAHASTERNRRELYLWPRGAAKSTLITRIATVHDIVYKRERYIALFSDTDAQAREKARDIRIDIDTNIELRRVYKIALSSNSIDPNTQTFFVLNNGVIFRAGSANSEARGFLYRNSRPTLIICDDIERTRSIYSPTERSQRKEWFKSVVKFLGSPDVNLKVVGTVLHPDSLLAELQTHPDFSVFKYRALLSFPSNTALWGRWGEIYANLDDVERKENAITFYRENRTALEEGARVLWEDRRAADHPSKLHELMATRLTEGEGAFNRELQNDPSDPEKIAFSMDTAEYFDIVETPRGEKAIKRDNGRIIPLRQLFIAGAHDPAGAPNRTGTSDYSAITIVGRDNASRLYVLDVWLRRSRPSEQIRQAFELWRQWKYDLFLVKETGTISALWEAYQRERLDLRAKEEWQEIIDAIPFPGFVTETRNKLERVSMLEPLIANKYLTFRRGLPFEFIDQMRQFPGHAHDDGPDALEECVANLRGAALSASA